MVFFCNYGGSVWVFGYWKVCIVLVVMVDFLNLKKKMIMIVGGWGLFLIIIFWYLIILIEINIYINGFLCVFYDFFFYCVVNFCFIYMYVIININEL